MRKTFVLAVTAISCLIACISLAIAAVSPAHSAKLGSDSPNFACVAAWNIGICVGPPTQQV